MDRDEAIRLLNLEGAFTAEELESAIRREKAAIAEQIARCEAGELKAKYRADRERIERCGEVLRPTVEGHEEGGGNQALHLAVGRQLAGRFELRRRVGTGPSGAVFAAVDRESGEEVAVKVLRPEVVRNEGVRQRLAEEVERASRLSHPGILKTFGFHQDGSLSFVVMALARGLSLRRKMDGMQAAGRTFSVDEAVHLGVCLCEAQVHAHQDTVHGGIKPENVFLYEDGSAKLTDFGTSRALRASAGGTGMIPVRAVFYAAPEQVRGEGAFDHRADQYATAVVLYEMLTGEPPVGQVRTIKERRKDAPRQLSRALSRALEPNPADRFPDMSVFGAALAGSRSHGVRRRGVWLIAALVLALAVVGVTYPHWRDRVETTVEGILYDPEAESAANAARLDALAASASWRRVAGLLGEEGANAEIAKAQAAFEEGDERLAASDYGAAADLFAEAVELYESQVAGATRFFRDEPLRVAATVRGMREGIDALEQELYDRLAVATARLESCEAGAGGIQTEEEREAIADCRRNAQNEVQLMERLIELTRDNVLSGPPRQAIADGLGRADSLLNEGRYRAALTAYADVKAGLAELLAWPERAEEALRREHAVSQEIERFRSALAAAGRDESEVQAELDDLVVQMDRARDVLAGGEVEEAMALFETVRLAVADLRAATAERLLQQARDHETGGRPSAAVSAVDELLAFNPGHAEGEALRERIVSRRLTNAVGMELVFIPPGSFRMGSPASEPGRDDDERMRDVDIAPGFYMSSTEVTQAQWLAVMGENPSRWEGDALPVEGVSWADAVAFCEELSRVDGRSYRLPTEAEWEYACRAGTTTPFSFGRFISPDQANYDGRYGYANGPKGEFRGQTVAVESFPPNPWGLHDMHGNVWEWCLDVYKGEPIDTVSVAGEEPSRRHALRGGSWRHRPMHCRCGNRVWAPADSELDTVGFRVVMESK